MMIISLIIPHYTNVRLWLSYCYDNSKEVYKKLFWLEYKSKSGEGICPYKTKHEFKTSIFANIAWMECV